MDQRERFEAHMRSRGETYLYRRDAPGSERFGQYCLQSMQREWENWQAAEAAALERAAQVCDEYGDLMAAEKDSALLVGKVDLSNAMSGESRAAGFLANAIRKLAAPVERGGE